MKIEKYFVLDIKHKAGTYDPSKILSSMGSVRHLNIPYIPLKGRIASAMPATFNSTANNNAAVQIALPSTVDHNTVYHMVRTLNDHFDVTLVGEKDSSQLNFEKDPKNFGMDHFTLGHN